MASNDPVPGLLHTIELVDAAIAIAKKGMLDHPSTEEERALNRLILRLEAERAVLEGELEAALASDTSVKGPSAAQLAQIEILSAEVEKARNSALAVSIGIAIAQQVLDVASDVVAT